MKTVKKVITVLLCICMLFCSTVFADSIDSEGNVNNAETVYVSLEGSKDGDGSIDNPFKTLQQARDYLRAKSLDADNRGLVYIRGGVYQLGEENSTVELNEQDSYVTYMAYPGEKVEITGTTVLQNSNFKKLDEAVGEQYSSKVRVPDEVSDKIYVYDLGAEGIPVGDINKNGFNWPKQTFQPELIVNDDIKTLAQYPNGSTTMRQEQILCGKTKDGKNEDETAKAAGANEGERPRNYWFDKTDNPLTYDEMLALKGPVFYARNGLEERISKWAPPTLDNEPQNNQPSVHQNTDNTKYETNGWLSGYFENNYANDMVRIYSVDMKTNTIHCKYPSLQGVQDKRIQLKAINMLCELDTQGEYYIDRYNRNNVLYYYPSSSEINNGTIKLTSSDCPFFELNNASGVQIIGLTLDGTTGNGITMIDCDNCLVADCELFNISMDAVRIGDNNKTFTADPSYETHGGGHDNVVSNCKIHDMGCGGVYAAGGNEQTLEAGNNVVEHCDISNISRLQTYTPAVYLEGVGNAAKYNYIHDAPHMVIQIMGNDMLVEGNKISSVCNNTSDQGAIYSGRCFNWVGNKIIGNYFENIPSGCFAIYMDDGMSGMIIRNNIFNEINGAAVFSNSGFGHKIEDNIFVNCSKTVTYAKYNSSSRPIANEKVLTYRYYRVLREGDGLNYTNTKENIENWYKHYEDLYPYLRDKYLAAENDVKWNTDVDSLFVPSYQELNHMVMAASKSAEDSAVSEFQENSFNTDNFSTSRVSDIDIDLTTGKIGSESVLLNRQSFGKEWVGTWNSNCVYKKAGIKDLQDDDNNGNDNDNNDDTKPNGQKGDVNFDNKVDLRDAVIVLKLAVGIDKLEPSLEFAADADDSGKVDLNDAKLILKMAVGII